MYQNQFRTNMNDDKSLFSAIHTDDTGQLALTLKDDPCRAGHIGNLAATCGNLGVLK